jgi:hypothetical protein
MGVEVIGKAEQYGQQQDEEFNAAHYHSPSDQYNPNWDFSGAIDDLQLLFMVGKRLAYDHVWPEWKAGSEFKAERDKSKKMRE